MTLRKARPWCKFPEPLLEDAGTPEEKQEQQPARKKVAKGFR
jgi:hypothetical protein